MRIHEQTESRLLLTGVPGRRVWMYVLVGFGLTLTGALGFFARQAYREHDGLALAHLALGVGLLVAQAILWSGAITLAVGRQSLMLDKPLGLGEYKVRSPIVEAGKPCKFKLKDVDSIAIEATRESRPGRLHHDEEEAIVYRVRLRLTDPRRAITLDETENDRLERLEILAGRVGGFLGKEVVRVDEGAG